MDRTVFLQVALDTPLYQTFDYLLPKDSDATPKAGVRIEVPFGRRRMVGIVYAVTDHCNYPIEKVRRAYQVLDETPLLQTIDLEFARWLAHYYLQPIGQVISAMLPSGLRQGKVLELIDRKIKFWQISPRGRHIELEYFRRSPKQRQVIELLQSRHLPTPQHRLIQEGFTPALLKRLQLDELIETANPLPILDNNSSNSIVEAEAPLTLNLEQLNAVNTINQAKGFKVYVLFGVTGSGKTEVYLQTISRVLEKNKQALVLIPEINLTPQALHIFQKRFQRKIVFLHSKCTEKERHQAWYSASSGNADIVIGTRSSIFTPMPRLGIIIVDEEHDLSYKQQDGFGYSARDCAVYRGLKVNVPVILGSATPSLETWNNISNIEITNMEINSAELKSTKNESKKYTLLTLSKRVENATMPNLYIADLRHENRQSGIAHRLVEKIREHLTAGQQVLIFLNRRGFAPSVFCNDCGWIIHCALCDARMTYHLRESILRCHHCEYHTSVPERCSQCNSRDLTTAGQGTEQIESYLEKTIKGTVIRIDRDTTQHKAAFEKKISEIHAGKPALLIGTQMLAKGHHFPKLTLVIILNSDAGLFSSDFRATERTLQLLAQVSGRAGRAETQGEVWVQTHHPQHPIYQLWLQNNYAEVARYLLQERKAALLPPFSHHILIRAESPQRHYAEEFLIAVNRYFLGNFKSEELFQRTAENILVLGPANVNMERKAGRHRLQTLLQSPNRKALHRMVQHKLALIHNLPEAKRVRWRMEVDPQELN
ncbi:MAG: primosomal protein N' [Pseudomonadota bacterium]